MSTLLPDLQQHFGPVGGVLCHGHNPVARVELAVFDTNVAAPPSRDPEKRTTLPSYRHGHQPQEEEPARCPASTSSSLPVGQKVRQPHYTNIPAVIIITI